MKFVVQKIWQTTKHQIVLKGGWFGEEKQKGFLLLSYDAKKCVQFVREKPENIASGGNLMEILRKHGGKIIFELGLKTENFIMFPVEENSIDAKVFVFDKQKAQWSFENLSEQISFFRCNSQNVYTGRKQEVSINASLEFESFKLWHKVGIASEDLDNKPLSKVKTTSRADLKKKLKRKLKTLSKSMQRFESELENNKLADLETQLKTLDTSSVSYGEALNDLHQQRKKAENKKQKLSQQLSKFKATHERVESFLNEKLEHELIENIQTFFSKEKIKWQAPSSRSNQRQPVRLPYRTFLHQNQVYRVGKAAADNDQLVKLSKPFDCWVHLQGSSSSHVVIVSSSKKFEPSMEQIKVAAILSNHYSKSKKALGAKIVMTKIHHLRKPKGLKPGSQLVSGEQVFDFSFLESEVLEVLNTLQK